MYSVAGYGRMIEDRVRMSAYEAALQRSVRPGSVVLDLGAGTGIMTLLACRLGARHVYAVEPADVIQVARAIVAEQGYTDRVTFIQDLSTRIVLPELAEVIVADVRGVLPLLQHSLATLRDARRRLLAPGGILIPRRDLLYAAVVEAPILYRELVGVWEANGYGFNLEAARRLVVNSWSKTVFTADQLLTTPQCWATLDYTQDVEPRLSAQLQWTPTRPGSAHGLCLWFDTELIEGVGFSNAPGRPESIYGHAFFPFTQPLTVAASDRLTVTLDARLVGDDYLYRWETRLLDAAGKEKSRFQQSSLSALPLSPGSLQKRAASYVPVLDDDGSLDAFILAHMDGQRTLESIARLSAAAFTERFPSWIDALPRVGELSKKYGR